MTLRHRSAALLAALAACALAACSRSTKAPVPQLACAGVQADWPQWALAPGHAGTSCALGQDPLRVLAELRLDDNIEEEKREMRGAVLVHYQQPLVVGDDVYVPHKAGSYVACDPPGSGKDGCGAQAWEWQAWSERKLSWQGGQLVQQWEVASDWVPPPNGFTLGGWEPVFHAAVAGELLWVPAAGGRALVVDRRTGQVQRTVDPLAGRTVAGDGYLTGPIVIDAQGRALWSVLVLDRIDPWGSKGTSLDAQGLFVRAKATGEVQVVPYATMLPQAPAPSETCEVGFTRQQGQQLPPADVGGLPVAAPRTRCGAQRAPVNSAPAVGPDGAVFLASRAHRADRSGYLIALNDDLSPRWTLGLHGVLSDGCGALVSWGTGEADCRPGSRRGVDPVTNSPPSARLNDDSTSAPVVLPDGNLLFGTYTNYNGSRGHLLKVSAQGRLLATYDFGWDITPAVFPHDGTYSIVLKDNRYANEAGPYAITQLDASLVPEWSYVSTNTQACGRNPDGSVSCADDHPGGFEWCVNSVAVDRAGVVYANSEDGYLYALYPGGTVKQRIFLNLAIGAAYTPLSLDAAGRIYTQNDGRLFVVGQ